MNTSISLYIYCSVSGLL